MLDIHKPALWNDAFGSCDTWAFVVLGERLGQTPEVLGWLTHPVHYDPDSAFYMGATKLGSFMAEREAMAWAGLWRLAQNTKIDTVFRTDSMSTAHQADGSMGCADRDFSFGVFGGIFQALETALPGGALRIEHLHGHCGEPYNEMVDWLARTEREKNFLLRSPTHLDVSLAGHFATSLDPLQPTS